MGRIRINSDRQVRRKFGEFLHSLDDGPVFVAQNRRVTAVLLDITDYYDLLGEIEDLMKLLQAVGGRISEEEDRLLDEVLGEACD